jgi:hypothetical protein
VNPQRPTNLGGGERPPREPHDTRITQDGRAIVNPPLAERSGGPPPAPAPRRNPDGSTTYPPGVPVPFEEGISQYHADGSVTLVPYEHDRVAPPPADPPPSDDPVGEPNDGATPPAPGSATHGTSEQLRNKLWRDEQRMHSSSTQGTSPSADDLRRMREGLYAGEPRQAIYVPPAYDRGDAAALARADNARLLDGLVRRQRERKLARRRDAMRSATHQGEHTGGMAAPRPSLAPPAREPEEERE